MELFRVYFKNGGQVIIKGDCYKVSDRALGIFAENGDLISSFNFDEIIGIIKESCLNKPVLNFETGKLTIYPREEGTE